MWLNMNILLALLVMFSYLDQCISAILFSIGEKSKGREDYIRSKTASVYRGLLFSYSAAEKNELCQDFFSTQLYAAKLRYPSTGSDIHKLINDGLTVDGSEPKHPLLVGKLGETISGFKFPDNMVDDIFLKCVGKNFVERKPTPFDEFHISYAFRSGWFYANRQDDKGDEHYTIPINYISVSAKYVPLEQDKLEEQYVNTQRNIRALEKESSKYAQLIEKTYDLSSLSKYRKTLLCASVLSSPIYRSDRLELPLKRTVNNDENLACETKSLKFRNKIYNSENFIADCILCQGFADVSKTKSHPTNLFLTLAYDDRHSLYVLKQEGDEIFLSKYFTEVPMLMNASEIKLLGSIYYNFDL